MRNRPKGNAQQQTIVFVLVATLLVVTGFLFLWKSNRPAVIATPVAVSVSTLSNSLPEVDTIQNAPTLDKAELFYDPINATQSIVKSVPVSEGMKTRNEEMFAAGVTFYHHDDYIDFIKELNPKKSDIPEAVSLLVRATDIKTSELVEGIEINVITSNLDHTKPEGDGIFNLQVETLTGNIGLFHAKCPSGFKFVTTNDSLVGVKVELSNPPAEIYLEVFSEPKNETFIVQVQDQTGMPISGAKVGYATLPNDGSTFADDSITTEGLGLVELITDASGKAVLPFLPNNQYMIMASATVTNGEKVSFNSVSVNMVFEEVNPLFVPLKLSVQLAANKQDENPQTAIVRGVVVDEEGALLAGIKVSSKSQAGENETALTNQKGEFLFNLAEGNYTIYAIRNNVYGYDPEPISKEISFSTNNPIPIIKLVLLRGDVVDGYVVDSEGNPIADVVVSTQQILNEGGGIDVSAFSTETSTDAEGHFELKGLPKNGSIPSLSFRAVGYEFHERTNVSMKDCPLNVVLKKASGVVVMVVWAGGTSPVTQFAYRLGKTGFNDFEMETGQNSLYVESPEGKFELNNLDQGAYRVEVNLVDENLEPLPIRDSASFKISAENEQQVITLTMVGGFDVVGTVRSATDKAPIENAVVSFVQPYGGYQENSILAKLDLEETTDSEGKFRFEGIPAGRYTLNVISEELILKVGKDFEVISTSAPAPLEILLHEGGKIYGYVLDQEKNPMVEAQLSYNTLSTNVDGWGSAKSTVTDEQGYYELKNLNEGVSYVYLYAKIKNGSKRERVVLALGEEKRLDFDFSGFVEVSGKATVNGKVYHNEWTLGLVNTETEDIYWIGVYNGRWDEKMLPGKYKVKNSLTTGEGETITIEAGTEKQTIDINIETAEVTLIVAYPDGTEFQAGKAILKPENMAQNYAFPRFNLYAATQYLGAVSPGSYRATFVSMDKEWLGDSGLIEVRANRPNEILLEVERKPKTNRVGGWKPDEIPVYLTPIRLDLTGQLKQSGAVVLYLEYEKGRYALACESAVLYQDGTEVSRDTHEAWAGADVVGTQYYLNLPKFSEEARYEVELQVRCDGGTDSTGSIYLKH